MKCRAIALVAFLLTGCATSATKQGRFVEAPYCTVLLDRLRYRFHTVPGAAEALTAAAQRWRQQRVHLSSKESVEFNCLRWVQRALERGGKTVSYEMDR